MPWAQGHGLCRPRQPAFAGSVPLRLSSLHRVRPTCTHPTRACFRSSLLPSSYSTPPVACSGGALADLCDFLPVMQIIGNFLGYYHPPASLPEHVAGLWGCLRCVRVPLFLSCPCHGLGARQMPPRLGRQSFLLGFLMTGICGLAALARTSLIWSVRDEQMRPGPLFVCVVLLGRSPCDSCPYGRVNWLPCV